MAWSIIKWCGAICALMFTLMMLSPVLLLALELVMEY